MNANKILFLIGMLFLYQNCTTNKHLTDEKKILLFLDGRFLQDSLLKREERFKHQVFIFDENNGKYILIGSPREVISSIQPPVVFKINEELEYRKFYNNWYSLNYPENTLNEIRNKITNSQNVYVCIHDENENKKNIFKVTMQINNDSIDLLRGKTYP